MIEKLPLVNACLNGLCTVLLLAGRVAIARRKVATHVRFMVAALITSTLFLGSYVTYHYAHGATPYPLRDWTYPVYMAILITHTLLATANLPMVIVTVVRALQGDLARHRRIARLTFPIWLYVSFTGVLIYLMLHVWA